MKNRFNTYDIICMITELQRLIGMRVNQVYDIDNRTYVIRLQRSEEKSVLLLESGNRFHTTQFEWPKNMAPSGFTMKLRKHLKNKRLERLTQLGIDRIVDLQFGMGEAAYHVILELYDRGNIVLTDCNWTILNVLRPHVEGDKIRFAVKEKYPLDRAKTNYAAPSEDALKEILAKSKPGDNLKKILNPNLEYGSAIIDHVLLENGLSGNLKVSTDPNKGFFVERDLEKLVTALNQAEKLLDVAKTEVHKGYIIQKKEERPSPEGEAPTFLLTNVEFHPLVFAQHRSQPLAEYETFDRAVDEFFSALEGQKIDIKIQWKKRPSPEGEAPTFLLTNVEFHPLVFAQHRSQPLAEYETFDRAVDEFFSALEGQKIDIKTVQVEREAMKKLQNVRKDHEKRVNELLHVQVADKRKAELIARNEPLVEQARLAVQTAIANQMSWDDIKLLVKTAQDSDDPVASRIKELKLKTNHITLLLDDPYRHSDDDEEEESERLEPMLVDIDLSLTAFANSRRYYDQKRNAAKKQQKTIESADKALKSAERKTKQTLKEANAISSISKARKTYWFEKFFWFISSDNYLVIGGRDQQQNELLVKRYLKPGDIYVHADITGASSVIVKNPTGGVIPPKTLSEAGQAAVAYSVAWEAKVMTRAWWVHAHQVSKSAPTGEYLTTGSFMIRGKKNYLLPDQLHFGFTFMFRLEDSCIERHRGERKTIVQDDTASDVTSVQEDEQEIIVSDDDEPSDKEETKSVAEAKLETISEETTKSESKESNSSTQSPETEEGKTEDGQNEQEDAENRKEDAENGKEDEKEGGDRESETDSDDDSSSESKFPNTHIKVDHGTGEVKMQSKMRTMSEASDRSEDTTMSFPSLPKRGGKKPQKGNRTEQKKAEDTHKDSPAKRGQRGKIKKIKEKYRHQDEEDKERMMAMLQSGNNTKESKKAQKKAAALKAGNKTKGPKTQKIPQPAPIILEADSEEEPEPEPEQETTGVDADAELLSQLTGSPFPEDELLFAVPVVAPYAALHNYKYKVKLTPGTSKRGKAAKTAVQVFLKDRSCTPREKDLLKAVKEENIARNFPGKVKLSAPQLHKHRK